MAAIERRILAYGSFDPRSDLLAHVGRYPADVAVQAATDDLSQAQFRVLDLCIEFAELRRKIEPLLDKQVFDRIHDRTLALGQEFPEVVLSERIAEQDVEGR